MKGKLNALIIVCGFILYDSHGQSVSSVINTTGTVVEASGYSHAYSIGEVAISFVTNDNYSLSEGFLTGYILSSSIELGTPNNQIQNVEVYPNPAKDEVNILASKEYSMVRIFDNSGKLILSQKIENNKFSVKSLKDGNYFLLLLDARNETGAIAKIIKL